MDSHIQFFSWVTKPTDLGIINGFPREQLTEKIKNQMKLPDRLLEERKINSIVSSTLQFLRQ